MENASNIPVTGIFKSFKEGRMAWENWQPIQLRPTISWLSWTKATRSGEIKYSVYINEQLPIFWYKGRNMFGRCPICGLSPIYRPTRWSSSPFHMIYFLDILRILFLYSGLDTPMSFPVRYTCTSCKRSSHCVSSSITRPRKYSTNGPLYFYLLSIPVNACDKNPPFRCLLQIGTVLPEMYSDKNSSHLARRPLLSRFWKEYFDVWLAVISLNFLSDNSR